MAFRDFLLSESGATTVDWVVMTSGATGMCLGTIMLVSGGISNLSGDIDATLADYEITGEFTQFAAQQLAANDFAGGLMGGWTGGTVANAGGVLGELLMVGPGGLAELTLDVPHGANQAVFTFDLIGGDSLDDETATVTINGLPVTFAMGNHGAIAFTNPTVPGVTVQTAIQTENAQLGGSTNPDWRESVTSVSITVDNPGSTVTLGVSSDADQAVNDEFFGIDNVVVDAQ